MKTKTLVLAAAALTACALTASAQSNVYSLNIVGYVNVEIKPGYNLLANPLDNGAGNVSSNLVPANIPNGTQILVYNPVTTYTTYTKKSSGIWNGATSIPPGSGFFVRNTNAVLGLQTYTNTFVGNVAGSVPGSLTNTIQPGYNLVGSMFPIASGMTNVGSNTLNIGLALPNGSQVLTYDPVTTYTTYTKKSSGIWNGNPTINVGQGFFVRHTNGVSPITWIQNVGP